MDIKFYRANEDITMLKIKKNDYITTIGSKFITKKDKTKRCKLSSKKNLDNLMQKNCIELLSKDIYEKNKCCRICQSNNVINMEDYDGICLKCYDKLKPYFESLKISHAKNDILSNSNILDLRTKSNINLVELKDFINDYVANITQYSHLEFRSFKFKRTSGFSTVGTFSRKKCIGNKCDATITYSHVMHPSASISTLFHEFSHLYLYVNYDNNNHSNEILVQTTQLFLNSLFSNDNFNHSYYYLNNCKNKEYDNYIKEAEKLALIIYDLIYDYLKKTK